MAHDVRLDPYGISPLVAAVNLPEIDQSQVQRVQVVVTGKNGGEDFERVYSPTNLAEQMDTSDLTFPDAGYHVPVLGLYPECVNSVRVVVDLLERDPVDLTLSIETRLSDPEEEAWVPDIQVSTAGSALIEKILPGHGRIPDRDQCDAEPVKLQLERPVLAACYDEAARGIAVSAGRCSVTTSRCLSL